MLSVSASECHRQSCQLDAVFFFVENEKYRTQHGSLRDTDLDTEGDECQPYTIHRVTGTWLYANTARCGRAFEPADSIEGR